MVIISYDLMTLSKTDRKQTVVTNMIIKRMLEDKKSLNLKVNMRFIVMFVTAVCVLFLIKLPWPKKKITLMIFICILGSLPEQK